MRSTFWELLRGKMLQEKNIFFRLWQREADGFLSVRSVDFPFGVPVSILAMLGEGIKTGAVLSMSILQFGFAGGAAGLALLLPHEVIYLTVFFYFMRQVYNLSLNCWKGRGIFPQAISGYCLGFLKWGALYMGGILLEIYVNPWLVEKTVKFLDFF